jgi:hypothetical protein
MFTGLIYTITNQIPSEKGVLMVYVGQTRTPLKERWKGHLGAMRSGGKMDIYKAMREHGVENFVIAVLEEATFEDIASRREWLNDTEAFWIKELQTQQEAFGYNRRDAGYHGAQHPGTPAKIGAGVRRSFVEHPERRARQAEIARIENSKPERVARFQQDVLLYRTDPTNADRWEADAPRRQEHSRRLMEIRWADPEEHTRMSETMEAMWEDPAFRAMMENAFKEAGADPVRRAAIQERLTAQWADPEFREDVTTKLQLSWEDPGRHAKASATFKALWQDPAFREKTLAARSPGYEDPASRAAISARLAAQWADPEYKARVGAAISAGHARRRARLAEAKARDEAGLSTEAIHTEDPSELGTI